jgi:hypothetical protein
VVIAAAICYKLFFLNIQPKPFSWRKEHVVTSQKNAGSSQFQFGHREDTAR